MIEAAIRENVKLIVTAYRRATKMSVNGISKEFYGQGSFLREFMTGKSSMSVGKLDRMLTKFSDQWPADAEWPLCRAIIIPRPKPGKNKTHPPKKSATA